MLSRNRAPWVLALVMWGLSLALVTGYSALRTNNPEQVRAAECVAGANDYHNYLTRVLHTTDYFSRVPPHVWTVVRYQLDADGRLLSATVLSTNGTSRQAQYAVDSIYKLGPYASLPEGARGFEITELFWREGTSLPSGSLAEELSKLVDGRRIELSE